MDYQSYIVPAYGLALLLIGGLIVHTLLAARSARKALAKQDQA